MEIKRYIIEMPDGSWVYTEGMTISGGTAYDASNVDPELFQRAMNDPQSFDIMRLENNQVNIVPRATIDEEQGAAA